MQVSTIRNRRASAFTLIELLVVIAIIAILAAILFPVFAQARQAARGASSQSNLRQLSLGILMYVQDYDETYPMFQSWYPAGGGHVNWGSAHNWSEWTFDIAPYLKNAQIFADPLYGPSTFQDVFDQTIFTDYGYNYTTLSPSKTPSGTWIYAGSTLASINQPSTTDMLTGRCDDKEYGAWWYGDGTLLSVGNAEAPDCGDIPAWCYSDWCPNGNYSLGGTMNEVSGLYTGGNALRKGLQMNMSFTDGHCKYMPAGGAAIGTNWHKGSLCGSIHITDNNLYMWQVQ